jgi:alginate O-acetyltransferase complex protein AlgI
MRNYLYVPLGGNRVKSKFRIYFNLWLVFLASGFWHGAAWTFIFWGVYHGIFLVLERAFLLEIYKKIGKPVRIILTFLIVAIGWVFFRAESFSQGLLIVKSLFNIGVSCTGNYTPDIRFITIVFIAVAFSFFVLIPGGKKTQDAVFSSLHLTTVQAIIFTVIGILLFVFSLSSISSNSFNPFIYFRF